MNNNRNKIITLIMILLTLINTKYLVYSEEDVNYKLENVLVRLQGQSIVKLTMGDYGRAFSAKSNSDLYNFLIGDSKHIQLVGISNGDKYISIGEYGRKFSALKSMGDLSPSQITSKAIENSVRSESLPSSFLYIDDYKVDIMEFNIGNLKSYLTSNQVETSVSNVILNNPIKTLNFAFDKPVKITKLNGTEIPQIFLDKIIRSGYSLDSYYDEYSFVIGDDYKYSMIFDLSSDSTKFISTITVATELGYERNIKIIFNR